MTLYLGENIKRLRQERGLTQEVLAEFLGVTFQTVSNWERGESYPDITLLPELAGYFQVSMEQLLGVNKAETEKEIACALEAYDRLTDGEEKREMILQLKQKFPNDHRILLRYMTVLVHFNRKTPEVLAKILAIYENIKQNCKDDSIRISAKRHIAQVYAALLTDESSGITVADCEELRYEMPKMRDGRELLCFHYPKSAPHRKAQMQAALEEQMALLCSSFSRYIADGDFSKEWMLSAAQLGAECLNFVFDDGNYGRLWPEVIRLYVYLGVGYAQKGETDRALENLQTLCQLACRLDQLECVTTMHAALFAGRAFDKRTLGTAYSARAQVRKELAAADLPEALTATQVFCDLIERL